MRRHLIALLILAAALTANAQEMVKEKAFVAGHMREWYLYNPDRIAPGEPLVIMLHGYGGHAENYRPEMLEVARRYGFALCIPEGMKDPKGKQGWNVRYPAQKGMKTDDVKFVVSLAKKLQKEYGFSALNTFLCGMSNGGDLGYAVAWNEPGAFAAIASVAGLTFEWLVDESYPRGSVPFMEVHGTEDRTSEWGGDHTNAGGWGAYIPVPMAISYMVAADKCKAEETVLMPLKDTRTPSRDVVLHRYYDGVGGCEVRLYEVVGAAHSWHLADMDTCDEIWKFFSQYVIDPDGKPLYRSTTIPVRAAASEERGVVEETVPTYSSTAEKQVEPEPSPETVAHEIRLSTTDSIIEEARKYLGKPYKYAGAGPSSFDCSGFTSFIFKKFGTELPHSSADQYRQGTRVDESELRRGDLVFFNGRRIGSTVGHVGIVVDVKADNTFTFIHSAIQGGVIISDSLEPYYSARYQGARRIIN